MSYAKKPKPYLVLTPTGYQISSHFTRLGAEAMARRCNLQQMEVRIDRQLLPDAQSVQYRHKGVDMEKVNAFLERKGT